MNDRIARLRERSLSRHPALTAERSLLMTRFYAANLGKHPVAVLRALAFQNLCRQRSIDIEADELIVGERGPGPKVVPLFPELTCHSLEDLATLNGRSKTAYTVPEDVFTAYEAEVIPYWRGRSLRDRIFAMLPPAWHAAYDAGVFTEFMEQRAPGHTAGDGKLYVRGLCDLLADIDWAEAAADPAGDPALPARITQWQAMRIAADAAVELANRYAVRARALAAAADDPARRDDLRRIAEVCARVPGEAPRDFHEAIQMYWFCHLGVITELNGWDAFSPGHLDQHLEPFYQRGLRYGTLTREQAKELLECLFVKFNNQPAPPKVGVTDAESATYTDFADIDLAGLRRDGSDGVGEVSYLLLEVAEEMRLVQPSPNVQVSRMTPDRFLQQACAVVTKGLGYPALFNADGVVGQLLRQGKRLEDAREGGTSGCVETGAFGKEAYILTGYLNLPKLLELALHDGLDPRTGVQLGPHTGDPSAFTAFSELLGAWEGQLRHLIDIKLRGNQLIEHLFATEMPAPFLSLITSDCVERGQDYNAGGARYNTSYIQGVGIGTLTDSLAALQSEVFGAGGFPIAELLGALAANFEGHEPLRLRLVNRAPKWGNDDDAADDLMRTSFDALIAAVDGRPNGRGGRYGVDMLPTTCHIYFGSVTGATPDGREAGAPLSEGISPSQGADRHGPTAVFRSAAKMDHGRTCGTLLNMKLSPGLVQGEEGIAKLAQLIRTYFRLGGHHVQFNVVSAETLREAQRHPDQHRDLIVRVAGYSDYFCDLSLALQNEIIARTEHAGI